MGQLRQKRPPDLNSFSAFATTSKALLSMLCATAARLDQRSINGPGSNHPPTGRAS
jgi:hypothetical protein